MIRLTVVVEFTNKPSVETPYKGFEFAILMPIAKYLMSLKLSEVTKVTITKS